jgi:quinol-cytochrome oxidoreductase complex cytochrome b subunit
MSYWAATVITSLTTVVPFIGNIILSLIWGGFGLGQQTLTRFYSFHFVLPFVLLFLIAVHLLFLHETGSSDPIFDNQLGNDKISFHPYYTFKDILGIVVFMLFLFIFVFFAPNVLGHPLNYIQANPGVTPVHIVPEWYFLPFYGILRAIPSKLFGVIAMLSSILILALLPFLNTSGIKNAYYRPVYRYAIFFLLVTFIMLGWIGYHVLEYPFIELSRVFCFFYFGTFLVFPLISYMEKASIIWY